MHTRKPRNGHKNYPSTTFLSKVIKVFLIYGLWVAAILDFGNKATSKIFSDGTNVSIDPVSFVADGDTVTGPSFRWRLEEAS